MNTDSNANSHQLDFNSYKSTVSNEKQKDSVI